jgi:hypothetical protein
VLQHLPLEQRLDHLLDAFVRLGRGRSGLGSPRIRDFLDEVLLPEVAGQQLLPDAQEPRAGLADDPNLSLPGGVTVRANDLSNFESMRDKPELIAFRQNMAQVQGLMHTQNVNTME